MVAETESVPQLLTAGRIAAMLRQPTHRILYILASRKHIQPSARAGRLRLFDRKALAMIRHELNAIDARRCGTGGTDGE